MPDVSRQLTALSDLTNVVIWELVVPDAGIIWHAPFERLLAGPGPPRHVPGAPGRRRHAPLCLASSAKPCSLPWSRRSGPG